MKRRLAILGMTLVIVGGVVPPASSDGAVDLTTNYKRYRRGVIVEILLVNRSDSTIVMGDTWTIERHGSGEIESTYVWPQEALEIAPGESRLWSWLQDDACYGECQNVRAGEPVGSGRYVVAVMVDGTELRHPFDIGEFFTLGFRGIDASFVVFVRTPGEVAQMEAEAEAEEKRLIVSGIVRRRARYNPTWSYSMGPGTIVLGEVFIEVCDASPYYVEEHRDEWLGERWCPWSSYVDHVGK